MRQKTITHWKTEHGYTELTDKIKDKTYDIVSETIKSGMGTKINEKGIDCIHWIVTWVEIRIIYYI